MARETAAVCNGPIPHHPEKLEKLCRLCRKYRGGVAAVEFAVVAPLFFLLVFGMIEYGRLVMVQQLLTNASREGARTGVVLSAADLTLDKIRPSVTDFLTDAGISTTNATVTAAAVNPDGSEKLLGSANYGDGIKVSVSIPFGDVSYLPSPKFLNGKTLTTTTVMRYETAQ